MSNKSYHFTKQGSHDNQGGETKVMKKILSVALSTAMAFSMFASVAFGAEAEKKLTTQEKYDFLKEEGIFTGYKDGTAGLDKTMTRAEFATVVARLLDLDLNSSTVSYNDKLSGGGVYNTEYWAHGAIEAVTAAGLMQGKNAKAKLFDPNGDVTVEEMAKVLVLALDIEVPAEEPGANWSKHYVAAAVEAGLIPAGSELKAPALRSLLVDASYAAFQAIEDAKLQPKEVKVVDATHIEVTFTDGEVVKVELEKALEANKETEVKVTHPNGKEYTVKATYVVTAAQKIESVKADNLKEIVVAFDGEVDEKSATAEYNYTIDGFEVDSVSLSEDKKSAKILLKEDSSNDLVNQKEYELEIKNVKNSDESKTFDQKVKFKPVDITLPKVQEVVGLGTKAFKVVFSEPVRRSTVNTTSNYKVDGKSVSGYVDYSYPNVAIISTELSVGEHKLEVSNVEDFANYKNVPEEITFTVAEDTVAPEVVSGTTKDLKKVEIFFNEPVKSVKKAYHTSSSKEAYSIEIRDNKATLFFNDDNKLSLGENTVYLEGVTDYSNNSANREAKVTPQLDSERPYVANVKTEAIENDSKYRITVEFSKDVETKDATNADNFTLKKESGSVVDSKGFNYKGHPNNLKFDGKKKVTIETIGKLDAGKYVLEVNSIRDTAAVPNTMLPFSKTIDFADVNRPNVSKAWYKERRVSNKYEAEIYVQFDKALAVDGSGKADDINKYNFSTQKFADDKFDAEDVTKFEPFPKDTKVELANANTVKLILPRSETKLSTDGEGGSYFALRIINVADTKGNFISGSIKQVKVAPEAKVTIQVEEATATSRDTVKVKFDGIVSSINDSDFEAEGLALTQYSKENKDGKTEVVFKVKSGAKLRPDTEYELSDGTTAKLFVVLPGATTQNEFGKRIESGSYILKDEIKPELDSNRLKFSYSVTDNTYSAVLTFNEHVKFNGTDKDIVEVKVNGEKAKIEKIFNVEEIAGKFGAVADGKSKQLAVEFTPKTAWEKGKVYDVELTLKSYNANSKAIADLKGNGAEGNSAAGKLEVN
ncbi:S-layer homology domain-containing protein [Paenibacillus sp. MSJ-34]|uniref:S-layer homology domain-containing protein n=1 Tax=Paenibacillus sp. MSJ-34 TaxID=2841529 RepID=UPI001C11E6FE|nr:S-layer homology domain-containing protein [Paenibacillus sp. MSJ-34]MBU5440959.1 S-layer homology domain-containing protein [Paenibacillus sp. MSJ-34]